MPTRWQFLVEDEWYGGDILDWDHRADHGELGLVRFLHAKHATWEPYQTPRRERGSRTAVIGPPAADS